VTVRGDGAWKGGVHAILRSGVRRYGRIAAMDLPVADSWARIAAWLTANSPTAAECVLPPVPPEAVNRVAAEFDGHLPADLLRWWQCMGGVTTDTAVAFVLPPGYLPYPPDEALLAWRQGLALMSESGTDADAGGVAGAGGTAFDRRFLPIATDTCGQMLYLDLRSGDLYGCVMEWDPESPNPGCPMWPNVAAMLADTAAAMTDSIPALSEHAERMRRLGLWCDPATVMVDSDGTIEWE